MSLVTFHDSLLIFPGKRVVSPLSVGEQQHAAHSVRNLTIIVVIVRKLKQGCGWNLGKD